MHGQPHIQPRRAAVIGWPVSHSLSPKLHTYWLKEYGIHGEYIALATKPESLMDAILNLKARGYYGANVTIPYKESVIQYLDRIDPVAESIGAVNTIWAKKGKLLGFNTDAYGFAENIRPHIAGKKKAVLLGAGGAAKAVCKALRDLGFEHIVILNRTLDKAAKLARQFDAISEDWDLRSSVLEGADLLVNTTSLGLEGKEPLELDFSALPLEAVVTDIVYKPLITPMLAAAKARGNKVVDGLGMLVYQAVPGFEMWFDKKPDITPESLEALKKMLLA